MDEKPAGPLADAARRTRQREREARRNPEPSLAKRLAQVGVLGWMVVGPTMLGVFAGRWLDRQFGTGITMAAALTMAGAALGFWFALRWMHEQ